MFVCVCFKLDLYDTLSLWLSEQPLLYWNGDKWLGFKLQVLYCVAFASKDRQRWPGSSKREYKPCLFRLQCVRFIKQAKHSNIISLVSLCVPQFVTVSNIHTYVLQNRFQLQVNRCERMATEWLLTVAKWLLMVTEWLLMVARRLMIVREWLLMVAKWLLMVTEWLLMVT
jgi:hypothetical protein